MVLVLKKSEEAYFNNGQLLEIKFYTLDILGNATGEESFFLNREGAQSFAKRVMMEANLKLKKASEKPTLEPSSPTPPTE